jgi:hypothetical protein
LNARVQLLAAFPAVEVGVTNSIPPAGPSYSYGWYNPFFAGQLAWDLGKTGWGFSYLLGVYPGVSTPVAFTETSLNQRFALSYTRDGWNLTANVIWGTFFDSNRFPDFVNVDLTATKKFGNWEIGVVGFGSNDLNVPAGLLRQSQFALGGLVGYYFGPVILQGYLTRDVSETNHGGFDTRIWGRIIIPVLDPPPAPAPVAAVPLYRRGRQASPKRRRLAAADVSVGVLAHEGRPPHGARLDDRDRRPGDRRHRQPCRRAEPHVDGPRHARTQYAEGCRGGERNAGQSRDARRHRRHHP